MGRKRRRSKNSNDYKEEGRIIHGDWYNHYFNLILEIALTRFQWTGIPEEIDERMIENLLIKDGRALFFKSKELGYTVAGMGQTGSLDKNYNPTQSIAVLPLPVEQRVFDTKDSVPIYNNYSRSPMIHTIALYAEEMADLTTTMRMNTYNQRTTKLLGADENTSFSVKEIQNGTDSYAPILFVRAEMLDSMKSFDMSTPFVADKLEAIKKEKWNEIMAFLGINNNSVNKAERVQSAEVRANDEQVMIHMLALLKEREVACKKINKLFGLNVQVRPREYQFQLDNPTYERSDSGTDIGGRTDE